jgi:hypothetical protein
MGRRTVTSFDRSPALRVLKGLAACGVGVGLAALLAYTTLFDRLNGWIHDAAQRSFSRTIDVERVVVFSLDRSRSGACSIRRAWKTEREGCARDALLSTPMACVQWPSDGARRRAPGDEALAATLAAAPCSPAG